MKIAIAGGTGFIGTQLTDALVKQGHTVYILTRSPDFYRNTEQVIYVEWLKNGSKPWLEIPSLDAIVNLAGDSLFGYWTKAKKHRILTSRLEATEQIIELILQMKEKPEVLINASAIGFYGTSETKTFTEKTSKPGDDFLAMVTDQWEHTANQAELLGVRIVLARFGMILDKDGALLMMSLPFKFFLGGKTGNGKQWMSWIHIKDVIGLIIFAIHNQKIAGPLNVTSPQPIQNLTFSHTLAKILHRPCWLPAPSFALQTLLGEMSILVVKGQAVLPEKAKAHEYQFQFPKLESALENILLHKSAAD